MNYNAMHLTEKEIKELMIQEKSRMVHCPFCGNNKVKVTKINLGYDIKFQGICNKCFSRGPAVKNDVHKAVNKWNERVYLHNVNKLE